MVEPGLINDGGLTFKKQRTLRVEFFYFVQVTSVTLPKKDVT